MIGRKLSSSCWLVGCFYSLSTSIMVMSGRSVNLTTLFPGHACLRDNIRSLVTDNNPS